MATWIGNYLEISGNKHDINKFVGALYQIDIDMDDYEDEEDYEEACQEEEGWLQFENIVPLNGEEDRDTCKEKYGITRSGAANASFYGGDIIFYTAGNTPLEFFIEASKVYPNLSFSVKDYDVRDVQICIYRGISEVDYYIVENGVVVETSIDLEQRRLEREDYFESRRIRAKQ